MIGRIKYVIDWATSKTYWRDRNKHKLVQGVDELYVVPAVRKFLRHYHTFRDEYVEEAVRRIMEGWDGNNDEYTIRYLLFKFKAMIDDLIGPSHLTLAHNKDLVGPLTPDLTDLSNSFTKRKRVSRYFTAGHYSAVVSSSLLYTLILPGIIMALLEVYYIIGAEAVSEIYRISQWPFIQTISIILIIVIIIGSTLGHIFRHLVDVELEGL